MSAIAELITPATADAVMEAATPAKPVRKRAPRKSTPKVEATPAEPTMEEREAVLRSRWDSATAGETSAKTLLDAAKISWENTRVIKTRVAFETAMLVPNAEGKPNLLNAARILGTDPEDTPAARTKAAKNRKNSLRNYVNAGVALDEKGLANRETEPDAEERKIVAEAFRAGNKRPEDEAGKGEGEGGGSGEGEGEGTESVAMGAVDIIGHIARMQASFKLIQKSSVVISETEAANIAEMLAEFEAQLTEYAEGK